MGERDGGLIADLDRLLNRGVDPERDGDLLARFRATGDHDAFKALVMRHGPMVRGVCLRLLRDANDADDAFQATFLVLARKGGGLRDPDRLGPWLYGVASRVAAKARSRSARRKDRPLTDDLPARGESPAEWSDVLPILDAELARLPSKQREVLVACLLGGASEQEAARSFGCPVGTVKSRLSRGRETLRARLVRRGIAPSIALAAASAESLASSLSPNLTRATIAAASAKAEVAPAVVALMKGVVPTMASKAMKLMLALVLAGGAGWAAVASRSMEGTQQDASVASGAVKVSPEAEAKVKNLKQVLLAMHQFASVAPESRFPSQNIYGGPQGRSLLSWRVALLPYLGEEELYKKFHLDEPWDSPHNLPLLPEMPAVYQSPDSPTPQGQTRFLGFWGPGTVFDPIPFRPVPQPKDDAIGRSTEKAAMVVVPRNTGVGVAEIQDGTSNTAMLAVSGGPIEWTRPIDLSMQTPNSSPPSLDTSDPRGLVVGMADGAVRFLRDKSDRAQFLSAIITRAGGEVVNLATQTVESKAVLVPLTPQAASVQFSPPVQIVPTNSSAADPIRRLERLEEKLDLILKRLDGLKP